MRTIEEIREHIKKLWQEIEGGDVRARHNGPNCPGCLYSLLEFIDSEPPCRHKRVRYLVLDYLPVGVNGWYLVGFGNHESARMKHCPDCGEELPAEGPA